ncbi:MAG: hypothetical protein RL518_1835 [Pseudomonadota bacterium]|jgi:methyl-accepting chemotaxis protein
MNIKTRLYVLTVLNVVVCITIATVGYVGIQRLHPLYTVAGTYRAAIEAIDAFESAQEALRTEVLRVASPNHERSNQAASSDASKEAIRKHAREFESRHIRISTLRLPVEITWNIADSRQHVEHLINLAATIPNQVGRDPQQLDAQMKLFSETFQTLRNGSLEAKSMLHALWNRDRSIRIAFADSIQNNVVTMLLLGIASIIILGFVTLRSILRPIADIVTALGVSASEVDTSAQKMSVCAEDLARSATQQAAAVQESVASMTQMSGMIAQTGDSSIDSLSNVRRMAERTQDGNRIMERLAFSTEAINQANTHLREMVDIIGEISGKTSVINDIVFKTQLLSFNASIEAARAGQHGRGFAVVAEEFGNLAEMSGKAAKEIQSLLETSKKHATEIVEMTQQRVADGIAVSKEALEIFNEISRDANQITKQIQKISEATREQTIGVQQTSTAMNQMDQAAQRNSILAGDTLKSASDLSRQSRKLTSIMRGLLGMISAKEAKVVGASAPQAQSAPQRTHIVEFDNGAGALDLAFLQDAAAKLGTHSASTQPSEHHADDDDFHPYSGSSPR